MEYRRRLIDDTLDEEMPGLPAIALESARRVGKTATAGEPLTPARVTAEFYREHLTRLFTLDPVQAWTRPSPRSSG